MTRIVADENIPFVKQAFAELGEVACVAGRDLTATELAGAEVLLVRSITSVGSQLLDRTEVRFVGTATIGTDHIDRDYLDRHGIAFADAAGSNANSVAQYVVTALLVLAEQQGRQLQDCSLGIIGLGNIGARVERYAQALGMSIRPNDPPLERHTHDRRFVPLENALSADFVTLHVPLTRDGPNATYHLIDESRLARLHHRTALINTSRGAVVDNTALKNRLNADGLAGVVLDVWEHEPRINPELLERVTIATPHIAGYSLDGKVNGTIMLYQAVREFLKSTSQQKNFSGLMPPPPVKMIELDTAIGSDQQLLCRAMNAIYDIMGDDRALRKIDRQAPDRYGRCFDQLRKNYHVRREAHNTGVTLQPYRPMLAAKLAQLGFKLTQSS